MKAYLPAFVTLVTLHLLLREKQSLTTNREWVLLIHQLPPKPTNLRVRIWRKLQKLGAVAIKNSVYVLPANDKAHEDFQWLKQEIESAGGEAVQQCSAIFDGLCSLLGQNTQKEKAKRNAPRGQASRQRDR